MVVELTTLVSLGMRPSLHAAARQMPALPVLLEPLHDEVNHTEPGILRALVRSSAEPSVPMTGSWPFSMIEFGLFPYRTGGPTLMLVAGRDLRPARNLDA